MLSIIILSFNTWEITRECLKRVKEYGKGVEKEVIVWDNASSDNSGAMIKKVFKEVKLVESEKNIGFARGNNKAMEMAKGDYFLLLNSDAFIDKDTLQNTVAYLDNHPECDVVGGRLRNKDGSFQQSYGYFPTLVRIGAMMSFIDNLPGIRKIFPSIHVRDESRYTKPTQVDWVTGAFVALRREVWEKTGGLDEQYFMYGEENEWMFRMKKQKFKIWYIPEITCTHLVGASSEKRAVAAIGEMKGWRYWFEKYYPKWQLPLLFGILWLGCSLRILVMPERKDMYRDALKQLESGFFGRSKSQT